MNKDKTFQKVPKVKRNSTLISFALFSVFYLKFFSNNIVLYGCILGIFEESEKYIRLHIFVRKKFLVGERNNVKAYTLKKTLNYYGI